MKTLLMVVRSAVGVRPDSESVVIDTDTPGAVVIELDDGGRLELDELELRAALRAQGGVMLSAAFDEQRLAGTKETK